MWKLRVWPSTLAVVALIAGAAAGCGKDIGDSCVVSTDCDPNGTRICIDVNTQGGYCTIQGCDYDTCPGDSECVSFFTGDFSNLPCDHTTEDKTGGTNDCSEDELCDLTDHCTPRSGEVRYCMAKCGGNGDCRDGYECRDLPLMIAHGGQPVLAPGDTIDDTTSGFCALAP